MFHKCTMAALPATMMEGCICRVNKDCLYMLITLFSTFLIQQTDKLIFVHIKGKKGNVMLC